ncbi:MAG TPA: hypothetical protein VHK47_21785 [Polyangia bacterium]|jgi:hypothetical protein|nr:hypothetical protein [Polyangia bacterium]
MGTELKETSMSENTKRPATRTALRVAALAGVVALGAAMQGCGGNSGPATVCDPPQVDVTWTIEKQSTAAPLSCAQAGAAGVELTIDGVPYDFDCEAYEGLTTALQPGNHTVDLALFSVNDDLLSQTPQMPITVHSCGVTVLPQTIFDVQ